MVLFCFYILEVEALHLSLYTLKTPAPGLWAGCNLHSCSALFGHVNSRRRVVDSVEPPVSFCPRGNFSVWLLSWSESACSCVRLILICATQSPPPPQPQPPSQSLLVIRASAQIMTLITEQQCDSVRGFSSETWLVLLSSMRCDPQKKREKNPHWDHPWIIPGYGQSFKSRKSCGTIAYSTKRHNLVLHQFEEDVTAAGPHRPYESPTTVHKLRLPHLQV